MNGGSQRIDRLFSFALVILSVLAASEFQFVSSIPERQEELPYAFRVLTYPIFVLMIFWMIKMVVFPWRPGLIGLKMAFTEFCWDLWADTLFMYLIFYSQFASGSVSIIRAIAFLGLAGLLALAVSVGYQKAEPGMVYFRRRWRRLARSSLILALAYGFTILLFLP